MNSIKFSTLALLILSFHVVFGQNLPPNGAKTMLNGISIKEIDNSEILNGRSNPDGKKLDIRPASLDSTISPKQVAYIIENFGVNKFEFHDFKGKIDIHGDSIKRLKNTRKLKPFSETDSTCFTSDLELYFTECREISINMANLKTVDWKSHRGYNFIEINNSVISHLQVFTWFSNQDVWLYRSCLGSAEIFCNKNSSNSSIVFDSNVFIPKRDDMISRVKYVLPGRIPKHNRISTSGNYEILEFTSNKIIDATGNFNLAFEVDCDEFICKNNDFQSSYLIFNGLKINSSFNFFNNQHEGGLGLKGVEFPPKIENTYLDWKEIGGHKILTFSTIEAEENWLTGTQILDGFMISSNQDTIYQNFSLFKNLISQYKSLLDLFNTQGDQISYNGCYKEMKEIQTQYFKLQYLGNKSVEGWFNWKINQFLNWYCDYGTNPVKALIYCFYVLLIFSGLYIVFPSEKDNLASGSLIGYFNGKISLFYTQKKDVEAENFTGSESLGRLEELARLIQNNKSETPLALSWFGGPITRLMLLYLNLRLWLNNKFAMPEKRLAQKSTADRLILGTWITLHVVGFLFWGLVMRILNAFALSLNAFVTLGYGEIEAIGIARYLAVLEGALGWFFLGIFSVSLISQILQ